MYRVQTHIRVNWNGQAFKNIFRRVQINTNVAGAKYRSRLKRELLKTAGSEPVSGIFRRRVRHSSPGQSPFWQTGNLANSLKFSQSTANWVHRVRISTDVEYAAALELGGVAQVPQSAKKYTRFRLVNPIKKNRATGMLIDPRPAWMPIFMMMRHRLVKIIRTGSGVGSFNPTPGPF